MYGIVYDRDALKALVRMSADRRRLIQVKLGELASDPTGAQPQVKPLKGNLAGLYRLRVGDWRVIYQVDAAARLLRITNVRPRGGAYD